MVGPEVLYFPFLLAPVVRSYPLFWDSFFNRRGLRAITYREIVLAPAEPFLTAGSRKSPLTPEVPLLRVGLAKRRLPRGEPFPEFRAFLLLDSVHAARGSSRISPLPSLFVIPSRSFSPADLPVALMRSGLGTAHSSSRLSSFYSMVGEATSLRTQRPRVMDSGHPLFPLAHVVYFSSSIPKLGTTVNGTEARILQSGRYFVAAL